AGDYLQVQSCPIQMPEVVATGWLGIEYRKTGYGRMFAIRHGTLMILLIIAIIAPWASSDRKRFSLRTLLIAITLLAVALGVIIWLANWQLPSPLDEGDFDDGTESSFNH